MGQLPLYPFDVGLELARRTDQESLRARSQPVRVERRHGNGDCRQPCRHWRGTETDGSIICPAAVAGLVGLKPTVGLVSRTGIIPIAISQDTAGPMGRTVTDVALLMNSLAAIDEADPAATGAAGKIPADYLASLKTDALNGKHFGVLRQAAGFHPDVDKAVDAAIAMVKAQGAEVRDIKIPHLQRLE